MRNNTINLPLDEGTMGTMEEEKQLSDEEIMEFLQKIAIDDYANFDIDDDDDDETSVCQTANDYHNRGVDKARKLEYSEALRICKEGVQLFPDNIDLLADIVQYAHRTGEKDEARKYIEEIKAIPYRKWTWRGYHFIIEFLLDEPEENEAEIRELIKKYREYIGYEEKSYMVEYELEKALGNEDVGRAILEILIETIPNAPQCALKLTDYYFERGNYEKAIHTANHALMGSCEIQSSINIPYLTLLITLSKEAVLRKKKLQGEKITQEEIDRVQSEYEYYEKNVKFIHFRSTIRDRLIALKLLYATE